MSETAEVQQGLRPVLTVGHTVHDCIWTATSAVLPRHVLRLQSRWHVLASTGPPPPRGRTRDANACAGPRRGGHGRAAAQMVFIDLSAVQ